ncbi:uncharacterized protein [Watersipora subatra]|uniref:uncharacterized protein n=1 Tax=Watersipora subatra TaxID=2589382 RepID=UPI00355C6384
MTRKRRRVRPKPKVAVETPNEDILAFDSGNDSPQTDHPKPWSEEDAHSCSESIKAWKFYQACVLERYHWFLDERRQQIANYYSRKISDVYLRQSSADVLGAAADYELAMSDELSAVEEEEKNADELFSANIKALEAGKPMANLPLIDTRVTPEQVSKFILKYTSSDGQTVLKKESMNLSFTSSTSSEDSGLLMADQVGCLGLLTDDLWKPDEELFHGSFSVDQFYQPPVEVVTQTMVETPSALEVNAATIKPNIADEDSAIKAVVYSQDSSTLATLDPSTQSTNISTLTSPDPPMLVSHNPPTLASYGPPMLTSQDPLMLTTLPTADDTFEKTTLANFEDSLSHLTTEYDSILSPVLITPKVDECLPSRSVMPVLKSYSGPSALFEESYAPKEEPVLGHTVDNQKVEVKPAAQQEAVKSKKSTKAPVKFVDKKRVGAKDAELVKEIKFSWTDQSSVSEEKKVEARISTPATTAAITKDKPLLSFAAVAASTPVAMKPMPAKITPNIKESNQKEVFSTKKPSRKFAKTSCLNKTSLCWSFVKNKKCSWGEECIYAHGRAELRPFPKWYGKNHIANNGKIIKPPHPEPCENHYCPWRRHHLLIKTEVCKLWENHCCPNTWESCRFAHGAAELRPLPKLEICRLNQKGKCKLKSSECVYAHDASELRKKKQKKAKKDSRPEVDVSTSPSSSSRLRTISETSASSYETSWSAVVGSSRVRTISGTSWQSESSQGMRDLEEFDWVAWNSQAEVPTEEELDESWNEDECVICSHQFTDLKPKYMLECEHTNFHEKCITQWLERKQTCPICRCPADSCEQFTEEQWYLE